MAYIRITPELEKKVIEQYAKSTSVRANFKLLGISQRSYYLILKNNGIFKENNPLDLVGKKFNRLTVLKYLPKLTKLKRKRMYKCVCECGKNCNVCGNYMVRGSTKSCGCYGKEVAGQHTVTHGLSRIGKISPIFRMFRDAKKRAKQNGVTFTIVISDITLPEYCPVFPWIKFKRGATGPIETSPSLDRINPKLGYIPGNVMVISHKANTIKSFGTKEEHLAIAAYIEKYTVKNVSS